MGFVKKITGWALFFLGLIIIFYSLYSSFNIFTAKTAPPEIFETEETTLSQKGGQSIEAQIQQMVGEQLKGMLPTTSLPTLLNLISWSIFAGILIFGGSQIASLGIKLLK